MKKFILYSLALLWAVVSIFVLNTNTVFADWLLDQKDATDLHLPGSHNANGREDLIRAITTWLGWLITILAIIALVVLVYGGILMITAAGEDDRYKKWFTILKQAAIWLIYIGLAWLFIMLVLFLIHKMAPDI